MNTVNWLPRTNCLYWSTHRMKFTMLKSTQHGIHCSVFLSCLSPRSYFGLSQLFEVSLLVLFCASLDICCTLPVYGSPMSVIAVTTFGTCIRNFLTLFLSQSSSVFEGNKRILIKWHNKVNTTVAPQNVLAFHTRKSSQYQLNETEWFAKQMQYIGVN